MMDMNFALDLRLFDEGGAGAGTGDGGGAAAGAEGQAAAAEAQTTENEGAAEDEKEKAAKDLQARRDAFEERIKGDDKDLFDERVQGILKERLKNAKKQETRLGELQTLSEKQQAVLNLLGSRYQDVDTSDPDAVMAALEKDDAMWERYADELGVPVDVAKRLAKAERENAMNARVQAEAEKRRKANETFGKWQKDGEALKEVYKNFDLQAEVQNPQSGSRFLHLLKSGVPVKTAYEVIHNDELMSGAIQTAVRTTQKKTTDDIRAKGMRPAENGLSAGGAAVTKLDPSKLTDEQLADMHKRALAGEVVRPFG